MKKILIGLPIIIFASLLFIYLTNPILRKVELKYLPEFLPIYIKCLQNEKWDQNYGYACSKNYKDGGKECFSNKDCLSSQCVVADGLQYQYVSIVIPDDIRGKCASDNFYKKTRPVESRTVIENSRRLNVILYGEMGL